MNGRRRVLRAGYAAGLAALLGCLPNVAHSQRRADPVRAKARGTAKPAWVEKLPLMQWHSIPNTSLINHCPLQPLIRAGLSDSAGNSIGFGHPRRGIFDFSGGSLKKEGSIMLVFGGGGAGAWAGNDVRGLALNQDVPAWSFLKDPSPSDAVWPRTASGAAHPYMKDGTPNARHAYWQPIFIDKCDRFMLFGCQNVWEIDSGTFNNVDGLDLPGGSWSPAGTYRPLPRKRGWDSSWNCKHPLTERVYSGSPEAITEYDPDADVYRTIYSVAYTGVERGWAAIDPKRNLLLRVGLWRGSDRFNIPLTLDLSGSRSIASVGVLTGPYAKMNWPVYPGFVFDPNLDKFVMFKDDGHLYTFAPDGPDNWYVDRLNLTPDPRAGVPASHGSSIHGSDPAIWGRMQYVPELSGIAILQSANANCWFIRTAA